MKTITKNDEKPKSEDSLKKRKMALKTKTTKKIKTT